MSLFNWEAEGEEAIVNKRFWVYLAVAGGVTVVTVGAWMLYTGVKKGLFSRKRPSGSQTKHFMP